MIEMSIDKETVLPSDQSAYASLPQQQPELSRNGAENPLLFAESTNLANQDGACTLAENGNKIGVDDDVVTSSDSVTQNQDGIQNPKPHQQRPNKRRSTVSGGFKHPMFGKRRRRATSESESVLPTNFLLGGNIFDPLNLNSLLDEEVNRALNAETPKSSPLPAKSRDPVEILIPRDITDPLNLNGCTGGDAGIVLTPLKSGGGRRRHRNRHHGGIAARGGVGRGREGVGGAGSVDGVGRGEGVAMELNQSEGGLESEPECTLTSSGINLQNSPDSKAVMKEEEKESSFAPKQEVHEDKDSTQTPVTHTSHRQRKRKRSSSSRSENTSGPCSDKTRTTGPESAQQHPPSQRGQQRNSHKQNLRNCNQQKPNQQHYHQQQKKKFQYGNYNQYYGYRNPGAIEDARIRVFKPEWFQGKQVLDLGCNTGHMTLTIAKNWRPARIVGLDIDGALIHAAKQNVRHYLSEVHTLKARKERNEDETLNEKPKKKSTEDGAEKHNVSEPGDIIEKDGLEDGENKTAQIEESASSDGNCSFPVSLCVSRGPIAAPPLPDTPPLPPGNFPSNVTFVRGNYVLDSDVLLETQREEFDVILCLSVTKWVHLNWGDVGLRRFFHRVYRHLRPGGLFILEPQPWNSYSKRKKLTEAIYKNYFSIQLKPEHFSSFLASEVGFSSCELLGTPNSSSRGFQRPIYLFHKGPAPEK